MDVGKFAGCPTVADIALERQACYPDFTRYYNGCES